MREVSVGPGESIAVAGEPATQLIVIRKGQVQEGNKDSPGRLYGAGSIFHFRELLLEKGNRAHMGNSIMCTGDSVCPVSLTAKSPVTIWVVPAQVSAQHNHGTVITQDVAHPRPSFCYSLCAYLACIPSTGSACRKYHDVGGFSVAVSQSC